MLTVKPVVTRLTLFNLWLQDPSDIYIMDLFNSNTNSNVYLKKFDGNMFKISNLNTGKVFIDFGTHREGFGPFFIMDMLVTGDFLLVENVKI
jgi:hypothetical protein